MNYDPSPSESDDVIWFDDSLVCTIVMNYLDESGEDEFDFVSDVQQKYDGSEEYDVLRRTIDYVGAQYAAECTESGEAYEAFRSGVYFAQAVADILRQEYRIDQTLFVLDVLSTDTWGVSLTEAFVMDVERQQDFVRQIQAHGELGWLMMTEAQHMLAEIYYLQNSGRYKAAFNTGYGLALPGAMERLHALVDHGTA